MTRWYINLLVITMLFSVQVHGDVRICDLRCDYRRAPLAVDREDPMLSWRLEGKRRELGQVAYHIQAATSVTALDQADLWDTGWVNKSQSVAISYGGKPLKSKQRAYWRVRVKDEKGQVLSWSDATWFEAGLLNDSDWNGASWIASTQELTPEYAPDETMGDWITCEGINTRPKSVTYTYNFTLPETPVVYAGTWWARSGDGNSWCQVNGDVPRGTKGRNSIKYTDFSFSLKGGDNTVELIIERGTLPDAVCMGMRIVFADGSERIIKSFNEWKVPVDKTSHAIKTICAYGKEPLGRAQINDAGPLAAAWYKRDFSVDKQVAGARLYICGLGYNEPYINGKKVGDHVLDPGQTDYEHFAHYQVFDVLGNLKSGTNTLAVLLGDGWYHQDRGFPQIDFTYGLPAVRAFLEIRYADGTTKSVVSDRNWHWKESGLNMSNIFIGDYMDYRKWHDQWQSPGLPEGWQKVRETEPLSPKLIAQDFEPIRVIRTIDPVKTWSIDKKTWIVDLGQNISGWVTLDLNEPEGTVIRIRCTELLTEDEKYLENVPKSFWWCHSAPQHHEIICDGKPHHWRPYFSYHGFRYAEISGLSHAPKPAQIKGVVVHTDSPVTATFKSSDPLLDRIFKMGIQTHLNNMHSILEDCPQREKCLWGGDLHASWATGFYALDSASFYRQQIRLYYTPPFGPQGIPGNVGVGKRISRTFKSFNWSVSPLFLTWRMYKVHGDLQPAHDHYEMMLRFMKYFEKDAPGLIPTQISPADHAPPAGVPRNKPDSRMITTMNFYAAATRFAELAEALGKRDDAAWSRNLAKRIHATIMTNFYDAEKKTFGNGTQDSLALAFGIVESSDMEAVARSLAKVYQENGNQFDGGFMSYHIYPQLTQNGYVDLALATLRNPDYPGLAGSIRDYDATTIFETFSNNRESQITRSFDHHAMNHPTAWMLNQLAGIRTHPDETGFQRILLAPCIPDNLEWIEATVNTAYGKIKSAWKQKSDKIEWSVTVPPNCRSEVRLEKSVIDLLVDGVKPVNRSGIIELTSGEYKLQWTRGK